MIDLQPRSLKLRERALRLVQELAGVRRSEARRALDAAGGGVRVAIVIARARVSAAEARRRLAASGGSLREALAGRS
jgi:N-acetylmuramic acid 6-phosphate etherase